ncbi:hypothetical protein [Stenotrophomonas sp. ZAC14D2_NAIMI4_7]|uniref:hypothetical protein n=1 Tax=Stenotrophomonas sp. ZAC14D2_NAIMI4_7 TaxID=2072405 RepID=UPI00131F26DF|nr:hypothetical protein [Stenotrophomonas sp. ZAC14D2_NAIMI4_7]
MTIIQVLLRPPLLFAVVATSALSGCKLSALDLAPPRVVQLSCSSGSAASEAPMVLILDSGQASVVWANEPSARAGTLTVEGMVYRLDFPPNAGKPTLRAVINRYDGRMELSEHGPGATSAAVSRQMSCDQQPVQPKV